MNRPKVSLDLDGVAYDFQGAACYMMRHQFGYGPEVRRENWAGWNWLQDQVHPDHWRWLWREGVEQGLFRHGHTIKGAIDGIRALSKFADLAVVTSRPKTAMLDTMQWLAFNRLPVTEVHIIGGGVGKTTVGRFDLAVDDAIHNADHFEEAGVPTLLFAQPWNIREDTPLITRTFGWEDTVMVAREVV